MPRNLPDSLPFLFERAASALTLSTESENTPVYETECPSCLGTLTLQLSELRAHRDDTVSAKTPVECGSCEAVFSLERSILSPADEEPGEDDDDEDAEFD